MLYEGIREEDWAANQNSCLVIIFLSQKEIVNLLNTRKVKLKFCFWSFVDPSLDRVNVLNVANDSIQIRMVFGQIRAGNVVQRIQNANEEYVSPSQLQKKTVLTTRLRRVRFNNTNPTKGQITVVLLSKTVQLAEVKWNDIFLQVGEFLLLDGWIWFIVRGDDFCKNINHIYPK